MDKTTTIRESLLKAISYETYRNLIDKYEAEGKSSGTDQSEDRIHYTALKLLLWLMNRQIILGITPKVCACW